MNLDEFITKKGQENGLGADVISRILMNAHFQLPRNVLEEKWEEQVMVWINNAVSKQREETMMQETNLKTDWLDTSILGGQAPQPQFQNNSSVTFNEFGEIIRKNIEEHGKSK